MIVGYDDDEAKDEIHTATSRHVTVQRNWHRDRNVYVSVECECIWEPEHGLQIVFQGGASVTKVGPFDGHLTTAAAYGRDDLEEVGYVRVSR